MDLQLTSWHAPASMPLAIVAGSLLAQPTVTLPEPRTLPSHALASAEVGSAYWEEADRCAGGQTLLLNLRVGPWTRMSPFVV